MSNWLSESFDRKSRPGEVVDPDELTGVEGQPIEGPYGDVAERALDGDVGALRSFVLIPDANVCRLNRDVLERLSGRASAAGLQDLAQRFKRIGGGL